MSHEHDWEYISGTNITPYKVCRVCARTQDWDEAVYKMPMDYKERMTGQEWCERFAHELLIIPAAELHGKDAHIVRTTVDAAAKRAAGIK